MAKQASKTLQQWAFHVADVNVARFSCDEERPLKLWYLTLCRAFGDLSVLSAHIVYVKPDEGDAYILGFLEAPVTDHSIRKRLKKHIPMIVGEYELISITGNAAKYEKLMKAMDGCKQAFGKGRFCLPKKKA